MNTIKFPNRDEIELHAADWISKIDRGLSQIEQQALDDWLEVSPLHGEQLIKCASMWEMLDILRPISKLMPMDEADLYGYTQTAARSPIGVYQALIKRTGWKPAFAMAACLALVLGGITFSLMPMNQSLLVEPQPSSIIKTERHQTDIGEMTTVVLFDGSLLQLNTDSLVQVEFSSTHRKVQLIRGEVYFDVVKNSRKPFVVESGDDRVTAIGTAFSVNAAQKSAMEVIVTEGKVRVNRASGGNTVLYDDVYLTPRQKVVVRNNRPEVSVDENLETSLAWREGMVIFQGENLADVVREIDRYTPLSFRLLDEELASISVGGYFKTGDLDQLLLVLEQNFGVAHQKIGSEILLSKASG